MYLRESICKKIFHCAFFPSGLQHSCINRGSHGFIWENRYGRSSNVFVLFSRGCLLLDSPVLFSGCYYRHNREHKLFQEAIFENCSHIQRCVFVMWKLAVEDEWMLQQNTARALNIHYFYKCRDGTRIRRPIHENTHLFMPATDTLTFRKNTNEYTQIDTST